MIRNEFERILETRIDDWQETKRRKARVGTIDQKALIDMVFALAEDLEALETQIKLADVQDSSRAEAEA